jgi:hypothetical protein
VGDVAMRSEFKIGDKVRYLDFDKERIGVVRAHEFNSIVVVDQNSKIHNVGNLHINLVEADYRKNSILSILRRITDECIIGELEVIRHELIKSREYTVADRIYDIFDAVKDGHRYRIPNIVVNIMADVQYDKI